MDKIIFDIIDNKNVMIIVLLLMWSWAMLCVDTKLSMLFLEWLLYKHVSIFVIFVCVM